MQKHVFIVYTNPVEGSDAEYNDWYSNQHLSDVLRIPGVVAAQRFALSDKQRLDPPYPWKYAAIYEIETDDLDIVIRTLQEWLGTKNMPRSEAMDPNRQAYFFFPITERRTATTR